MQKKITKILIANRGEIALRVIKTAKNLGIKTVTLFTNEEKTLPHASAGDECISLGSGTLAETYLNMDLIIDIAKNVGADAIHPGYGFLSEKAAFAKKVNDAGIIFIGPSHECIELMGDKKTSKIKIQELKVPSIPGYHGDNQDPALLLKEAVKIGFPVLIKASAGGGGKGMRIVHHEGEFLEALGGAKREAKNAFSDDTVLIEKFITSPRHIEIQVMSDAHGNHFHLFERECSIQRRYQKIVEESPSTALTNEVRKAMTDAATSITRGINYLGAGTIEFILDTDNKFYFLEMNTRLQVEHPVTEMVTGLDLVHLQIMAASGEKFPFKNDEIKQTGHAIEVRLYAEDPDNHFLPSIGKINTIGSSQNKNVRLDSGYVEGNEVSISFDPMLAKLVAYGNTREEAITTLDNALNEIVFTGETLMTNRDYLKRILKTDAFKKGDTYTHFVNTYASELKKVQKTELQTTLAVAAYLFMNNSESDFDVKHVTSPFLALKGYRNV
jgi:3-methylcrotonyl-CoA carboxylase alpha subunit